MTGPCDCCKPHERQGADREWRRIRLAQAGLLTKLRLAMGGFGGFSHADFAALDRSTKRNWVRK